MKLLVVSLMKVIRLNLDIIAVPGLLIGQSVPGQIQLPETSVLYDSVVDDVVDKVYILQQLSRQLNKQVKQPLCGYIDFSSLEALLPKATANQNGSRRPWLILLRKMP